MTGELTKHDTGRESGPGFERLNYYFGQQLGVCDFRDEQTYFREKLKLHNRCLHGHGIVSGLRVSLPEPDPAVAVAGGPAAGAALKPEKKHPEFPVRISCGLAIDPEGNELYLPGGTSLDLWSLMTWTQRKKWHELGKGESLAVYLALRHKEIPVAPRRPAAVDPCQLPREREYGRIRDGVCALLLDETPFPIGVSGERCDTCCDDADKNVVVLAKIELPKDGDLTAEGICHRVRRPVSRYPFNRVVAVNWQHGGLYDEDTANELLYGTGLRMRFARKVWAAALREGVTERASGVIDVLVYNRSVDGQVVSQPVDVTWEEEDAGYVETVTFKVSKFLRINLDCRVHIVLRGAFLLDRCCQPLDGTNIGGATPYEVSDGAGGWKQEPQLPGLRPDECEADTGPWVMGGAPGSNFESWFFVPSTDDAKKGVKR